MMTASTTPITTRDGVCTSYIFHPSGEGPWPGVLLFMDGVGVRKAMLEVGEQLATHGFFVLLPDLFYRAGPYEPMDAMTVFTDPEKRKILMEKFFAHATAAQIMSDTSAFLDWMANEPAITKAKIGTTGYCMGGRLSLIAGATYPDRIAATAAYHPGRIVTDEPESPHLLVSKIRSRVYIAQASDDPSFTDDQKTMLENALAAAKVDHVIEKYPCKHGWVVRDTPVYDEGGAERHWKTLLELFAATLK
jgi:carboxymethylenebutenolidase